MKIQYKKIQLCPTDFELHVFIGGAKKAEKKMIKKLGLPKQWGSFELEGYEGKALSFFAPKIKENTFVIWTRTSDVRTIVHELIHITWELKRRIGFKFSVNNQELQCYLIDYLLGEVLKMKKI